MTEDRFGLTLSTTPEAAQAYGEALDLMLAAWPGAGPKLEQALAADPAFALGHALKARMLQMQMKGAEAKAAADRARELAASLDERQRGHVEAVALTVEGRGKEALAQVRRHAAAYPRDALPLSLALGVYGLLGFGGYADFHEQQLALLESVAPAWDADWWFDTYLGWAHVECGAPARGIPLLDRALEARRLNAHGAHARAHAYYEAGEPAAGRRFIADWLPCYDRAAPMHCHLTWHAAIFALQQGDEDAALALYDATIRPSVATSPPLFTLADAASFLWRRGTAGRQAPAGDWKEVSEHAHRFFPQAGAAFADVHAAFADAGAGDAAALRRRIEELDALVEAGKLPAGGVVADLARAAAAYANGRYDVAADLLQRAEPDTAKIGGSHAQRDGIENTLISALARAGDRDRALARVAARAKARAGHLDEAWFARTA